MTINNAQNRSQNKNKPLPALRNIRENETATTTGSKNNVSGLNRKIPTSFSGILHFKTTALFLRQTGSAIKRTYTQPMKELAILLTPTALEIDPEFNVRPASIVSRIRRDTRFSHDKTMYRDHAWLGFRHPGKMLSECFVLFAEFERESYGYGMGMYGPNATLMRAFRERMLARPQKFLSLVNDPKLQAKFEVTGEPFKRPRYHERTGEICFRI